MTEPEKDEMGMLVDLLGQQLGVLKNIGGGASGGPAAGFRFWALAALIGIPTVGMHGKRSFSVVMWHIMRLMMPFMITTTLCEH